MMILHGVKICASGLWFKTLRHFLNLGSEFSR
jgi:hypothetical protein